MKRPAGSRRTAIGGVVHGHLPRVRRDVTGSRILRPLQRGPDAPRCCPRPRRLPSALPGAGPAVARTAATAVPAGGPHYPAFAAPGLARPLVAAIRLGR